MKKRMLAIFGVALLGLSTLSACGGNGSDKTTENTEKQTETEEAMGYELEGHLSEMPDYTLPAGATTDEIRAMAVKAMRDELTIEWYSKDGFQYSKTGVAAGKTFLYPKMTPFAGIPYANGSSGLFHWLLFYDMRTGELKPFDTELLTDVLGNTCYAGVTWGWAAVAADKIGWITTNQMVPGNGAILVGNYDNGGVVKSYKEHPTDKICAENGEQTMFEAYAQILPADGLLYIPEGDGNHVRMATSAATVVRRDDNTIDGDASYVYYQDQATGHLTSNYIRDYEGRSRHFAGNVETKFTFNEMFRHGYIPITMKVFTGEEPYVPAKAEVAGLKADMTFDQIIKLKAKDNYRMCYFRATVTDGAGNPVCENLYILNRNDTEQERICHAFPLTKVLSAKPIKSALTKGETYHLLLETQDATGAQYKLIDQDFVF